MSARKAKELLSAGRYGTLSTSSADMPGYPFGSLVNYALDASGEPLVQVSALAQHTRNILKDARVSLLVAAPGADVDAQRVARVTVLAEAQRLGPREEAAREAYFDRFPEARAYEAMDFSLFRLAVRRIRFIGGFGEIAWVERQEYAEEP